MSSMSNKLKIDQNCDAPAIGEMEPVALFPIFFLYVETIEKICKVEVQACFPASGIIAIRFRQRICSLSSRHFALRPTVES